MFIWNDNSQLGVKGKDPILKGEEVSPKIIGEERFKDFKSKGLIIDSKDVRKPKLSEVENLKAIIAKLEKKVSEKGACSECKAKDAEIATLTEAITEKDAEIADLLKDPEDETSKEETTEAKK